MLILALHLHLHLLHHRGAAIDYAAVAASASISWIIGLGPGEPAVIAAGIFAAKHKLDISPLIFWAWIGAATGGLVGWLIGVKAGYAVLTAPGPARTARLRAAKRGEEVFRRMEVLAIVVSPSWVAGLNRARSRTYVPTNVLSALVLWAAPLAILAYYAGPPILDAFSDVGAIVSTGAILVLVTAIGVSFLRRSRTKSSDAE